MSPRLFLPILLFLILHDAVADEVRVAVAANFASTMEALAERFEQHSQHGVTVVPGATGKHYAQISNGAPFDLFFAADVERPRLLDERGIAVAASRFTYAVGRLALWSPVPGMVDEGGKILETGRFRHLAIANPRLAPYGSAAEEVLQARGLWQSLGGRMVRGENIAQTFHFIASGNAELGFVAYAQIMQPGQPAEGSWWLLPQEHHTPIEQQAVLIKDKAAAREFLEFVRGEEGRKIIEAYGYSVP